MLQNSKIVPSFSTNDIDASRDFYVSKLGLTATTDIPELLILKAGEVEFMIYIKDNHLAATYTVLNFFVENIEETVKALKEKGIIFEQYPQMGTDENGIAKTMDEGRAAWFKDPTGNILSVMTEPE